MNWDSFVPDMVVALTSALIAIAIAIGTYILGVRRRERNALRSLIEEIHRRRALSPVTNVRRIRWAKRRGDFQRVTTSVLTLKDEIARTRELVREKPSVQTPLSNMRRACNRYLEMSERDPNGYYSLATMLRVELAGEITKLVLARGGLEFKQPGGGAFDAIASD